MLSGVRTGLRHRSSTRQGSPVPPSPGVYRIASPSCSSNSTTSPISGPLFCQFREDVPFFRRFEKSGWVFPFQLLARAVAPEHSCRREPAGVGGCEINGPITDHDCVPGDLSLDQHLCNLFCWEMHRSGEFEKFANRLMQMGEGLTLRRFSETRLDFLRDTLESMDDSEKRILQRLKIAMELMALARSDTHPKPPIKQGTFSGHSPFSPEFHPFHLCILLTPLLSITWVVSEGLLGECPDNTQPANARNTATWLLKLSRRAPSE